MGEEETEMVTISYEVSIEKAEAMSSGSSCYTEMEMLAAQEALTGRGSLYDRFVDDLTVIRLDTPLDPADDRLILMASALQLLKALVSELRDCHGRIDRDAWDPASIKAIRSAVPRGVADELLGFEGDEK